MELLYNSNILSIGKKLNYNNEKLIWFVGKLSIIRFKKIRMVIINS
jgi:hypothetical protein